MARKDASIWRYLKDWLRQRHYQEAYWSSESQLSYLESCLQFWLVNGTPDQQDMAASLLDDLGK